MQLQPIKPSAIALIVVALAVTLSACGHGGGNNDAGQASTADYTSFVSQLVQQTDATAEPLEINNRSFSFGDAEDEHAYDALF